jgi:WD40 repeat protein
MGRKRRFLIPVSFCLTVAFGTFHWASADSVRAQILNLTITPLPSSIGGEKITSAEISGSGLLAFGTKTGRVLIFDRTLHAWHGGWKQSAGSSEILGIAFSQDEAAIAALNSDEVTVWRFDDPTPVKVPVEGSVTAMALSSGGRLLALAHFDVSVIDVSSQRLVRQFEQQVAEGGSGTYEDVAFSSNSLVVAAASFDNIDQWHIESGKKVQHWECKCGADGVSLSANASLAAVGTTDAHALLWKQRIGEEVLDKTVSSVEGDHVYGIAVNPTGTLVAAGTASGSVVVWDVASDMIVARAAPTNQPIIRVTSSDDGQTLLVVGQKAESSQLDYDRWLVTLPLR